MRERIGPMRWGRWRGAAFSGMHPRMRPFQILCRVAAWGLLAFVVAVTMSPIELRPPVETTLNLDRAIAFALIGGAFAFGYPRRRQLTVVLLPAAAFAIEALQFLDPSRHPRFADAGIKALGAFAGAFLGGLAIDWLRTRLVRGRS